MEQKLQNELESGRGGSSLKKSVVGGSVKEGGALLSSMEGGE